MQPGIFNGRSPRRIVPALLAVAVLCAATLISSAAFAQTESAQSLPDAPSHVANPDTTSEASRTDQYPRPGQPAPVLTSGDKTRMALHEVISPYAVVGWLASAGYEQLTNSSPNWGTDRGAFGQRLGDSALRSGSEDFLSDGVLAPLFREDPRYYRLGPGHNVLVRVLYAATRPLVTRTDSGRTVPNFSQIGGNLAGAALTNAYYPQANRGVAQTMATFGSGLGGSALGDGIAEFFGGILFDHNFRHSH